MNIKTKIGMKLIDKKYLTLQSPELYNAYRGLYSMLTTPGQPVYTEITNSRAVREGYKMAVPIYRGIRAVVQAISGIPWLALDKNNEEITNHPFTVVWSNPNPEFSGQDNIEFIATHLILHGNAYQRPIYGTKGYPVELWPEMPDLIAPVPLKDKNEWLEWEYTNPETGVKTRFPKETFIHYKQFDPGNLYTGMGAIMPAGRVIDIYNEALDTQKVSMQNRGMSSGIFKPKNHLENEQMDKLRNRIRDIFLDKTVRREPWVISDDLDWIETSQTPVELDFNNSQKELIRQMAAAIGIDPWWVGDREHSSYNNVKEARRSLYEDVGLPILDDIKATLNLKLSPLYPDKPYITYDTTNIAALREDFGAKVTQSQALWSMGVPFEQINNKLELGFEEFPGWDKPYLPFSVAPVGSSVKVENTPNDNIDNGSKSFKFTEAFLVAEWKRVDSRRVAYWNILQKRFEPLYRKTGKAVLKSLGDKPSTDKIGKAIDKLSDEWLEELIASNLVIIEDFGKQTEENLKSIRPQEKKFNAFSDYVMKWVKAHAAESVISVTGTLKDDMGLLIAKATEDGLSVSQIASVIREYYDDRSYSMAMRIARTETASAAGYAQHQTALDLGFTQKRWISARDARTRDSHARLDGETIDINTRYSNGLMYPGDPSGNAEEVINCRCTETWER